MDKALLRVGKTADFLSVTATGQAGIVRRGWIVVCRDW